MKERRKRLLQNIYLREKNLDTNLPKILEPNQSGLDSSNQDYSLDFQKDYETKEGIKLFSFFEFWLGLLHLLINFTGFWKISAALLTPITQKSKIHFFIPSKIALEKCIYFIFIEEFNSSTNHWISLHLFKKKVEILLLS